MNSNIKNIELTDRLIETDFASNMSIISDTENYKFLKMKICSKIKLFYKENIVQKIVLNLNNKDYNTVLDNLIIKYGKPYFL